MELKFFSELPADLAKKAEQFGLENFYEEEERIPDNLARERERFFSQPEAWLLVFEKDEIIGQIFLHRRRIRHNDRDIVLGGIGKVCTRKDRRKQGIATMMLKEAMKRLREWGCDAAFLCANYEKTGSLYGQGGFIPLNKPYTYHGRSGRLYEENNGLIAPLNSLGIFKEMLNSKKKLHLGAGNW